jgi:mono/diheme cytochrome c family protein
MAHVTVMTGPERRRRWSFEERRRILTAAFSPGAVVADIARQFDVKPGAGAETVSVQCAACHSLDYIKMNSPFMSPATWKAEVTKMRKAFGAPIDDATAEEILGYVIAAYGVPAKPWGRTRRHRSGPPRGAGRWLDRIPGNQIA